MKINEEAIDHFFEPWKYPNEFGIREVKEEEIEVLSYLGGERRDLQGKPNGMEES